MISPPPLLPNGTLSVSNDTNVMWQAQGFMIHNWLGNSHTPHHTILVTCPTFCAPTTGGRARSLYATIGLSVSRPKAKLAQRLYDHCHLVQSRFGVVVTRASDAVVDDEEKDGDANEDEDNVSCEVCGSGAMGPGNDLVLCDGDHEVTVAYHQACLEPVLDPIPEGDWFCPAWYEVARAMDIQSKANSSYQPSWGTLTDGALSDSSSAACPARKRINKAAKAHNQGPPPTVQRNMAVAMIPMVAAPQVATVQNLTPSVVAVHPAAVAVP